MGKDQYYEDDDIREDFDNSDTDDDSLYSDYNEAYFDDYRNDFGENAFDEFDNDRYD